MYTNTNAIPTITLYFSVVLFTVLILFHEKTTAIKNAPRNRNAFSVNGSMSARHKSIK